MLQKGQHPFRLVCWLALRFILPPTRTFLCIFAWSLLVLCLNKPLSAQEAATYCSDVTVDECALVTESVAAMSDISSGRAAMSLDVQLQDIPDLPAEQMSLHYEHTIDFMLGAEFATLLYQIQRLPQPQLLALGNQPTTLLQIAQVVADDLNVSLEIGLDLSDEVAALLWQVVNNQQALIEANRLTLRLSVVDGFVYIHTDSIAPFAPDIELLTSGWIGADGWIGAEAGPLIELAAIQFQATPLSTEPELVIGAPVVSGLPLTGAGIASVDLLDPSGDIVDVLALEVLETEDGANNETRFRTTVNYEAFFSGPLYEQLLHFLAEQQGQPLSEDELEEFLLIGKIMGPSLLAGLDVMLTETIQNNTGHVTDGEFALTWDLTGLLTLASQSDPSIQLAPDANPAVQVGAVTAMSRLNQDVTISAPTGALIVPTEIVTGFLQ